MNFVKSFFLNFDHLNDYHMCLICLPFLLQSKDYKKLCNMFISITLSMCLLVLLKGTLKIPHPKYPHTFAFPSGHAWMVLTACYFLLKDNVKNYLLWASVIIGIEFLVCIFGNHHIMKDMFGGYTLGFVAILLVNIFNKFVKNIYYKTIFAGLFSTFAYLTIYYISNAKAYANAQVGGLVFYNLLTTTLCISIWLSTRKNNYKNTNKK